MRFISKWLIKLVVLSLVSGCTTFRYSNEEKIKVPLRGGVPSCSLTLEKGRTYISRFEGHSIFLYLNGGRTKCFLKKIK